MVVVWFQTYRVDPYSPAKFTKNRVRLENRPDWAVFGSDITTLSPDGVLRQGCIDEEVTKALMKMECGRGRLKIFCLGKLIKRARERTTMGRVTAALGQPVGPTVIEGRSGQSLGLD
ncbi:hypothetical protein CRG98_037458 [Punica granatum]|uniref:Uncharacterized protein n=1 Tax=Punica granatum TaxID=22663 RepID=A0A2I0IDS5_PUNGR|nr:hypothetical protein CRG98_037458 [Punica granatum]